MTKYYIVPVEQEIEINGTDKEDALTTFATNMESDMHTYFSALTEQEYAAYEKIPEKLTLNKLTGNEYGAVFHSNFVSTHLFNFYVLRRRTFKDGTAQWNICCELSQDTSKYLIIDIIRGTREDAIRRLKDILLSSK